MISQDLKKLIIRLGIFSIPIVLYVIVLVTIDPFNYFSDSNDFNFSLYMV